MPIINDHKLAMGPYIGTAGIEDVNCFFFRRLKLWVFLFFQLHFWLQQNLLVCPNSREKKSVQKFFREV